MKLVFAAVLLSSSTSLLGQTPQGSIERGKKVYQAKWCHSCHGTVGQGGERGARHMFHFSLLYLFLIFTLLLADRIAGGVG